MEPDGTYVVADKEANRVDIPPPTKDGEIFRIRTPFQRLEVYCGRTDPFPMEKGEEVVLRAYKSDLPEDNNRLYWRLVVSKESW